MVNILHIWMCVTLVACLARYCPRYRGCVLSAHMVIINVQAEKTTALTAFNRKSSGVNSVYLEKKGM